MKILLVSLNHTPEQTGIGKYQGEMAAWLVAHGHQVRVVTAPPYYPAWKFGAGYSGKSYVVEEVDGARVYRVPLYVPSVQSGVKRLVHLLSFALSSLPVIMGLAVGWRPNAILVTAPPLMATPAVLFAGFVSGAQTHLHVQDFEVDAAFNLGLLTKDWLFRVATGIERFLLRGFTTVSSISPRMRDRLLAKGVEEKRAFLIPNWAGVDDFDPAKGAGTWPERLKPDAETVLVLYSGNLGQKQGLEVIVDAARQLQDEPHIRFVISGDGAGKDRLVAQAEGLENVVFLPVQPLEDFIPLMIAADIHLLPQRAEAADLVMPSKLGNMLASGKPVIAGAMPNTQVYEAIQGCGIAVTPDSAEELVAAIRTLVKDGSLRLQKGAAGRRRAQADWSKDGVLVKLEALLGKGRG